MVYIVTYQHSKKMIIAADQAAAESAALRRQTFKTGAPLAVEAV